MVFRSSESWAKAMHWKATGQLSPGAETSSSSGRLRMLPVLSHPRWRGSSKARVTTKPCSLSKWIPPYGAESWSWPEGSLSKPKLASFDRFDPQREFFKRGAHFPLMIYIGGSNESRRSKDALKRRAQNADRRGWSWETRQSTKVGNETRDGGEHPKGKQKGRGDAHP